MTLADLGGLHKTHATPAPTDSVPLHSSLQLSVRTQQPGLQILPPETRGVPKSKGRPDRHPNGARALPSAQAVSRDPVRICTPHCCLPRFICPLTCYQPSSSFPWKASHYSHCEEEAEEPMGPRGGKGGPPARRAGPERCGCHPLTPVRWAFSRSLASCC